MKQLLKTDFLRLRHEMSFVVIALIFVALNILVVAINSIFDLPVGGVILSACGINNLGTFVAISVSLYNGREFRDNTIRNKITAGCKREQIFLSSFIVNQVMYAALFILGALTILIFGSFMLTLTFEPLFALDLLMMFLLGAAFCALMTFFTFVTKKTSSAMLIGILVSAIGYSLFMLMTNSFMTDYLSNLLSGTDYNYAFLEVVSRINIFSMDYLMLNMAYLMTYTGIEEVATFVTGAYINAAVVAVVWTSLAAVFGCLIFRRSDIK